MSNRDPHAYLFRAWAAAYRPSTDDLIECHTLGDHDDNHTEGCPLCHDARTD